MRAPPHPTIERCCLSAAPLCHPPCFQQLPRSAPAAFCPQPRIRPAGAVPIVTLWDKPGVTNYGHSAGKIHGCRQLPAVPTPTPQQDPPRDPRELPQPPQHRQLLVTTGGYGRSWWPSPSAEPPGSRTHGGEAGARWLPGLPCGPSRWPHALPGLPRAGLAPVRVGARVGAGPRASSTEHMICCGRFPAAWSQPRASAGDGFNCFQIR